MNPGVIVIIVCLFSDVFLFFFLGHWALPFLALAPGTCSLASLHSFFLCLPWIIQCLSYSPKWSWRCSWLREILVKLGSWSFVMKTHGICDATCSIYVFALDPDISPLKEQKNAPVIIPQSYFRTKGTGGYIDVPNHGLDFRLKKNSGFAVI